MDLQLNLNENESIHVNNAIIQEINFEDDTAYVLITYRNCPACRQETAVNLVVSPDTAITNESGRPVSVHELAPGMSVNAVFSSAMTRSIPPQAQAYQIRILKRTENDSTTTGRVIEVNQREGFILVMSGLNPASIIRFNLTPDTVILDPAGRQVCCLRLLLGLRVRVNHASFMTASIPPQTTAFTIQILRS